MFDPKYAAFTALDPFFDIVQQGVRANAREKGWTPKPAPHRPEGNVGPFCEGCGFVKVAAKAVPHDW